MPVPLVPGCPAGAPVDGAPVPFGFTAPEPPVAGAGEGEFSVPSLPVVVPAPPVPEYAPVLSRAVPVPGPSAPGAPDEPAVPVSIGAPALPPTGVDVFGDPLPELVVPDPPEVCATETT